MRSVLGSYICKQSSSRFSYYFNQHLTVACIFILIRKDEHVNRAACVNVALGSQRGSMLTRHVCASKSQTDSAKAINYRRVALFIFSSRRFTAHWFGDNLAFSSALAGFEKKTSQHIHKHIKCIQVLDERHVIYNHLRLKKHNCPINTQGQKQHSGIQFGNCQC